MRQTIEHTAAMMSVNHGPWWLETRYCGIAKVTPATAMAGQISFIPLNPAYAHTSQKGTSKKKNGRMRPTYAPRTNSL